MSSPDPRSGMTTGEWVAANNLIGFRSLGDGRGVWVTRKIYTWAICIGVLGEACFDNSWCYRTLDDALRCLKAWEPLLEPEPEGWFRHPHSGRRQTAA